MTGGSEDDVFEADGHKGVPPAQQKPFMAPPPIEGEHLTPGQDHAEKRPPSGRPAELSNKAQRKDGDSVYRGRTGKACSCDEQGCRVHNSGYLHF